MAKFFIEGFEDIPLNVIEETRASLNSRERELAIHMRKILKYDVHTVAGMLGTNQGRVSEAVEGPLKPSSDQQGSFF